MQPPPHEIRRLPLTTGVLAGVIGTLLGFVVLLLPAYTNSTILRLFTLLASFALLTYFPHCLAHFIVGEVVGLRFSHYILGSSPLAQMGSPIIRRLDSMLPRLGIRLETQSRKTATYRQRLAMFSSGATASVVLPLAPTVIAYLTLQTPWVAILPVLWIAYTIFEAYSSPRFGDLSHIGTKPRK